MGLLYFVLTTGQCNLQCSYCGGSFPKDEVGGEAEYDPRDLGRLLAGDDDATVAFYGGEPLVNAPFVERVMDCVKAKRFVIQTNGLLWERLDGRYWRRMDAVLLSLDGREELTDHYRGKGVYAATVKAGSELKTRGYRRDLIARMAVSESSDIFEEVVHLCSLDLFDHIHWQLDAGWSESWTNFSDWAERSYKPGILKLLDFWISALERGEVLGIVPFLGILKRLREGGPTPPCGSGSESYAVLPNGRVTACPIAFDAPWADFGKLEKIKKPLPRIGVTGDCVACELLRVCGGRCLYFNREGLWGSEGFRKVCDITKFTIGAISNSEGRVMEAVRKSDLSLDVLDYPKFNNSTEIIP
jgi:putative peptide-modifying radical SAM enzyme